MIIIKQDDKTPFFNSLMPRCIQKDNIGSRRLQPALAPAGKPVPPNLLHLTATWYK
jgi:hypothetical protein